jgi:hypothetical protein
MLDQLSVDHLRQSLQEKEQTVATLTEYLEQAATKLNAMNEQKAGGNPGQAFDPEMVERQMDLVESLQAAVKEWEELGVAEVINRMSTRLDDLRETILDGLKSASLTGGNLPSEAEYSFSNAKGDDDSDDPMAGWEALKAEMLGEEPDAGVSADDQLNVDLQEELDVLVNRPAPVDESCDERDAWVEAVDSREKYLISLIRALRVVEGRRRGSPDWESFTLAPAELRERVARLAADLQQLQRNSEVEFSIERARISRQESLIAQRRRDLDKARQKKGVDNRANADEAAATGEGRWKKFLGGGSG